MVHAVKAPSDVGLARRIAMVAYTEYASDPRVRREAETLVAEGHRVEAIVLRPRSGPSAAELDGVHLHEVPLSARRGGGMRYLYQYAVFFLLSSLLLFRLYRRVRFNLIYIHSLPDFQVFCALPFKCMRIPVLLDLHEPMPEIVVARLRRPTGSAWFRISAAIERLSCLFADHVIVANDGIRNDDMVGEEATQPLDRGGDPEPCRSSRPPKSGDDNLWHRLVQIEQHRDPHALERQGTKHLKVGQRVDVNQVEPHTPIQSKQEEGA